jgi:hypothetical protein
VEGCQRLSNIEKKETKNFGGFSALTKISDAALFGYYNIFVQFLLCYTAYVAFLIQNYFYYVFNTSYGTRK